MHIESDDIDKPITSIDVTKTNDNITNLIVTYADNTSADVDILYNANGDITQIGDTIITYA